MSANDLSYRLALVDTQARIEYGRRRAGVLRIPLTAIGVCNLAAAVWCLATDRHHLVVFYAPAVAVAVTVSWIYARRDAARTGIQLPVQPWALATLAVIVGAAGVSRLGVALQWNRLEELGPSVVWIAGYHLVGRWGRNSSLKAATVAMFVVGLMLATVLDGDDLVAGTLAINGLVLVGVVVLSR